jgi:NAD(P)-dependent dehydrogenase (short-subunit alcohol dehydrogenase family)
MTRQKRQNGTGITVRSRGHIVRARDPAATPPRAREGSIAVIDFEGQVAIVTGAGRGLGRLYALELARRNAQVVVNDLGGATAGGGADPSVADTVVDEITHAGGAAVASYESVDSPEGAAAVVQTALDAFGRVDAVISNAGIYDPVPFTQITPEQWRAMLAVHVDGSFHLAQSAFEVMQRQSYGRFVFIASNVGAFGQAGAAHYGTAKAAVMGLTNAVALEGERHGILANAVLPMGYSRMVSENFGGRDLPAETQAFFDAIGPEKVVPMAVYLASRECRVTHHNFSAAAGRYARVSVGLGRGWFAPGPEPASADDVAAHIDEIADAEGGGIPLCVEDEIAGVMARIADASRGG